MTTLNSTLPTHSDLTARRPRAALPLVRSDRLTWLHFAAAVVLGLIGVLVTFEAWTDIYTIATKDEEYSHIFIVPIVAGYLIWVRRMRFRHCRPSGTIVGPLMV